MVPLNTAASTAVGEGGGLARLLACGVSLSLWRCLSACMVRRCPSAACGWLWGEGTGSSRTGLFCTWLGICRRKASLWLGIAAKVWLCRLFGKGQLAWGCVEQMGSGSLGAAFAAAAPAHQGLAGWMDGWING